MCDQRLGATGGVEGEVDGAGDGIDGLFVAAPLVDGMLRVAGVDMSRFAAVCWSSRPVVKARNKTTTAKIAAATHPHVAFDAIESSGGKFCIRSRFRGSFGSW
jgi:hypothetical protein